MTITKKKASKIIIFVLLTALFFLEIRLSGNVSYAIIYTFSIMFLAVIIVVLFDLFISRFPDDEEEE